MIFLRGKSKRERQVSAAREIIRHDLERLYEWMGIARRVGEGEYPSQLREQYRTSMKNFLTHLGLGIHRIDKYVPEIDTREVKSAYNSLEGEFNRVFSQ